MTELREEASLGHRLKVVVVTSIPSPYQVEFFDLLARDRFAGFSVIYTSSDMGERRWRWPEPKHRHIFVNHENFSGAVALVNDADLVVFSGYKGRFFDWLMRAREQQGTPWAFWAERPGFRFKGIVGRIGRAIGQRRIRRNAIPVWGIGQWAVESYRKEIGDQRLFIDLPYFSNLDRFLAIDRRATEPGSVRFLFSGELSRRKGVDLLASAFVDLARGDQSARLTFMGAGPLEGMVRRITAPITDRVTFVGFKQWQDLPKVYGDHDVLIAPSRYDGWGLVVPEGLAAGMPVIATSAMGAARDLVRGNVGWIAEAGDARSLGKALHSAVALSADQRAAMVAAARMAVKSVTLDAGAQRFAAAVDATMTDWDTRRLAGADSFGLEK